MPRCHFQGIFWLLLILLLLLPILLLDAHPVLVEKPAGSQSYLAATRKLIDHTVRQNPLRSAEIRSIALTEEDLTAVANFVLLKKRLDGHAAADIHGNRLDFLASIKLLSAPFNAFLNIKIVADDAQPRATIRQLKIGSLSMPRPLVGMLQFAVLHMTPLRRYAQIITPLVRDVRIADGRLKITVNWDRDALTQMHDQVSDEASRQRLLAYQQKLTDLLIQYQQKRYISIGLIVQPLFALALDRTDRAGGDPVEENRALILVLGTYANGRNLMKELARNGALPTPPQKSLLLNRRIDTAQHFMGSAALAVSGHRTFADIVGLAKEINDTHSGSGFSFTDLAADRAGTLFGRIVTKSPEHARKAQMLLSRSSDESVFMPNIRDLPENLGPVDFATRFKNIDSPEFEELKRSIEERILSCAIYQ